MDFPNIWHTLKLFLRRKSNLNESQYTHDLQMRQYLKPKGPCAIQKIGQLPLITASKKLYHDVHKWQSVSSGPSCSSSFLVFVHLKISCIATQDQRTVQKMNLHMLQLNLEVRHKQMNKSSGHGGNEEKNKAKNYSDAHVRRSASNATGRGLVICYLLFVSFFL